MNIRVIETKIPEVILYPYGQLHSDTLALSSCLCRFYSTQVNFILSTERRKTWFVLILLSGKGTQEKSVIKSLWTGTLQ